MGIYYNLKRPSLKTGFVFPRIQFDWSFDSILRLWKISFHLFETFRHCAILVMSICWIISSNIRVGTKLIISNFSSMIISVKQSKVHTSLLKTLHLMSRSIKVTSKFLLTIITTKASFLLFLKTFILHKNLGLVNIS